MRATVLVRPKSGILDPQGEAVLGSLRQLGFAVDDARIGRVVDLELENGDPAQARVDLESICEQLLPNPLIDAYEIEPADVRRLCRTRCDRTAHSVLCAATSRSRSSGSTRRSLPGARADSVLASRSSTARAASSPIPSCSPRSRHRGGSCSATKARAPTARSRASPESSIDRKSVV